MTWTRMGSSIAIAAKARHDASIEVKSSGVTAVGGPEAPALVAVAGLGADAAGVGGDLASSNPSSRRPRLADQR
jgi:hypothetical protein